MPELGKGVKFNLEVKIGVKKFGSFKLFSYIRFSKNLNFYLYG